MQHSRVAPAGRPIDRKREPHYIERMEEKTETTGLGEEVDRLEAQVGQLLDTVDRLLRENLSLIHISEPTRLC